MKAVCSTQTKGAFTLSSCKNALFGYSHLENCPGNSFIFFFNFKSAITNINHYEEDGD